MGASALWSDVRYGLRMLRTHPAFTAVAVLSLALGIGLNSAIFSVVNAVLLRPLPVDRPDKLVAAFTSGDTGSPYSSSSYPDYSDLATDNTTLDGLAAHTLMFVGLEQRDVTRITAGEIVSANYFDVLGVRPALGRGFLAGDDRATATPTTVISYRMWQRDFAGDPGRVLGRALVVRGKSYAIVGVAPRDFNGLASGLSADLWVPVGQVDDVEPVGMIDNSPSPTGTTRLERRGQRWLFLTGRLKPGVTVSQAHANLAAIAARLERDFPQSNTNRHATVLDARSIRIHPDLDGALAPTAVVLMGAVGLVLLVACSNLASLLLARATARSREMALRLALGATRLQLMRQLIVESVLVSLLGGAAGLLLGTWATGALAAVRPPMQISVAFDFAPDVRVWLFTFGLSLATGLVVGLAPSWRASRPNLVPALKGETDLGRTRRVTLRRFLVAGQMAMSMVLLVASGLLLRGFVAATHADLRFDAGQVAYAAVDAAKQFRDLAHARQFYDDAERRLRALPGVTAVARADRLPFSLTNNTIVIEVDGVRGTAPDGGIGVDDTSVSVDYFRVLAIPLVEGRAFEGRDRAGSEPVAIVNETAARRFWPGRDPVGQHFRVRHGLDYAVVGVARDHPIRTVGEAPRPFVHFAIDQQQPWFTNLVARTDGSTRDLVRAMRRELLALEPRLVFISLEPLTGVVDATLFPARAGTFLLGVFGALALVLAVVGLYGVVAFNVSRRVREIGIRMALGADRGVVVRGVVREGLTIVLVGGLAGALAAALAARVLVGLLPIVRVFDPLTYLVAALVLGGSALLASVIPARRAASIDPLTALRQL